MKKLFIIFMLFVSLSAFAIESAEQIIENKWGIDYSNPEKYLQQTPNTEVSPEFSEKLKDEIGAVEEIRDLNKVYDFIHENFDHYSDAGYDEDPVDRVEQLKTSRIVKFSVVSGCTSHATLLASILRELGIPAIHIQGPGIGWALNDITEYTSGHAMVEAFIEGKWILLDSVNTHITTDYDPTDPVIAFNTTRQKENPYEDVGYFIMFKDYSAIDAVETDWDMNNLRSRFDIYLDRNYTLEYFEENYSEPEKELEPKPEKELEPKPEKEPEYDGEVIPIGEMFKNIWNGFKGLFD